MNRAVQWTFPSGIRFLLRFACLVSVHVRVLKRESINFFDKGPVLICTLDIAAIIGMAVWSDSNKTLPDFAISAGRLARHTGSELAGGLTKRLRKATRQMTVARETRL